MWANRQALMLSATFVFCYKSLNIAVNVFIAGKQSDKGQFDVAFRGLHLESATCLFIGW